MRANDKKVEEPARAMAVAGSFYPSKPQELQSLLKNLLSDAEEFPAQDVSAIVVPHAGYIFSGAIAATAYRTLKKEYKNIFLIGSSHHINFDGISIYKRGDYQTPLGKVKVNQTIVQELMADNSAITFKEEAHTKEHTLEVQLPFLQTLYKEHLQIIPIIVASSNPKTMMQLAKTLQPYFKGENLFVISSDLSHYPHYDDAYKVDMHLLKSLKANSPLAFLEAREENEAMQVQNLQTSACGWGSLLTLLYLTQNRELKYELLEYKNSGDSQYGEKESVVGYGALRVVPQKKFSLDEQEKKALKDIAKRALKKAVTEDARLIIESEIKDEKLKAPLGAFVTLYHKGELRGCIGTFEAERELYKTIIEMSISASRFDTRFEPIKEEELSDVSIEISVLTPREEISSLSEIKIGKDGIYLQYGSKNGTYLPHVASDMKWNAEEFVRSCCIDKAGMSETECKSSRLYTYQALVF